MKKRIYQNNILITYIMIFITILEIIFIIYLYKNRIYTYNRLSCITTSNNTCIMVIKNKEKDLIYKNSITYIDNKKVKYKIISDTKADKYNEIIIELNKTYKNKDILNCIFRNKKIKLIEIFKLIWEGDNY